MAPLTRVQLLPAHKARYNTTKRQGGDDRPSAARRRELRVLLVAQQDGLCAWCASPITVEGCELDKIEPAVRKRKGTRRGLYHITNVVAACKRCNRRRGGDQQHLRKNGPPRFKRGDRVRVLALDGYEDALGLVAQDASWAQVWVELDDTGELVGVRPADVRYEEAMG